MPVCGKDPAKLADTARSYGMLLLLLGQLAISCGIYRFKDVSIPPEVKTCRIQYIENKARFVNPQLSPQLTEKLRQKINNQTRLTLVQSEEADYDIKIGRAHV